MITQKATYAEAKQIEDTTNTHTQETQSYASITNLTTELETLKKELENVKEVNKKLLERLAANDLVMKTLRQNNNQTQYIQTEHSTITTQNTSNTKTNPTNLNEQTNENSTTLKFIQSLKSANSQSSGRTKNK